MDAAKSESSDFSLYESLVYLVVRKGVSGDLYLCDLSPGVLPDWSLVHGYTF